jgi:hypothetical protein
MHTASNLTGRAAPKERPNSSHVADFIARTGGGHGDVAADDGFFVMKKRGKQNQVVPHDAADNTPVCSGKFFWSGAGKDIADPAQYVIARTGRNADNMHLLRFYAFYEWGLKRPELILSVTGGALHFDLNSDAQSKILKGMMEGSRDLSPWFITGGTNSGIMKYVGCDFFSHCPLRALSICEGEGVFACM